MAASRFAGVRTARSSFISRPTTGSWPCGSGSIRRAVDVGTPVPLFTTQVGGTPQNNYARNYMVSVDGQRFLVNTLKEVTLPITVLLNWKPKP